MIPKQFVEISINHIVIFIPESNEEYDIYLDRCDTPEKVLGWVLQLLTKDWCTKTILDQFIRKAAQHHKFSDIVTM